jgi:hypothetical protein
MDADKVLDTAPTRVIRLWSAPELRVVGEEDVGRWAPAIVFADYLLHSTEFARPVHTAGVVVVNGPDSREVAPSLAAFLDSYVADDARIFG